MHPVTAVALPHSPALARSRGSWDLSPPSLSWSWGAEREGAGAGPAAWQGTGSEHGAPL